MNSITRTINKWTDKKFDEIDVSRDKHSNLKAFTLGVTDGLVDGLAILGAVTFVGSIVTIIKEVQKK